ncbi:MAG: hypothetical protein GY835_23630, partial [bacterium]|nr:hypothetical protein [bacterium]
GFSGGECRENECVCQEPPGDEEIPDTADPEPDVETPEGMDSCPSDQEAGFPEQESDPGPICLADQSRCKNGMLWRCVDGDWRVQDDCSARGEICTMVNGELTCMCVCEEPETRCNGYYVETCH